MHYAHQDLRGQIDHSRSILTVAVHWRPIFSKTISTCVLLLYRYFAQGRCLFMSEEKHLGIISSITSSSLITQWKFFLSPFSKLALVCILAFLFPLLGEGPRCWHYDGAVSPVRIRLDSSIVDCHVLVLTLGSVWWQYLRISTKVISRRRHHAGLVQARCRFHIVRIVRVLIFGAWLMVQPLWRREICRPLALGLLILVLDHFLYLHE